MADIDNIVKFSAFTINIDILRFHRKFGLLILVLWFLLILHFFSFAWTVKLSILIDIIDRIPQTIDNYRYRFLDDISHH